MFGRTRTSVSDYVAAFQGGKPEVKGLAGRIIRGKKPADFVTFTDDPDRKVVMFLGPDGLKDLIGKTGYEMLVTIGYEPEYLRHKVQEGNQFKLVVIPEGTAVLATWDNVIDMVCEIYPAMARKIQAARDALKNTPLKDFEAELGFRFLDVEKAGKADTRFMTYERFQRTAGTPAEVRAFLYFSLHLRELFRGDGHTDVKGQAGPLEYIAPNMRIEDAGEHAVLDIEVTLPPQAPAVHAGLRFPDKLGFEDATLFHSIYSPNLDLARKRGREAKRRLGLMSADKIRQTTGGLLEILIDAEIDFCDVGRLPVPHTFEDMWRWCRRILRSVEEQRLSDMIATIDDHPAHAVHNDSWWIDENGDHPDVAIPMHMKLVDPKSKYPFMGFIGDTQVRPYRPRIMADYTTNTYAPHLLKTGQGDIWVFRTHCRHGTDGVNLIPGIAELLEYVAAALDLEPQFMYKGHLATTDWFGPFCPCMVHDKHPQGGLQTKYLDIIRRVRATEIAGEAADFCVKAGKMQVVGYYDNDQGRAVLQTIRFLTDCTSAIFPDPDPGSGKARPLAEFDAAMAAKGIKLIKHDSPF